jgi:lysine decarboxylase
MVLLLGIAQSPVSLERVAGDLDEIVKRISREGTAGALVRPTNALAHEMAVSPRDAFLGDAEVVPVDDAVDRISCESIAGYPPGIPALLPGERITTEVIDYLRELRDAGARLHGASDPSFTTITVLVNQ